jgi:hypothetical protein
MAHTDTGLGPSQTRRETCSITIVGETCLGTGGVAAPGASYLSAGLYEQANYHSSVRRCPPTSSKIYGRDMSTTPAMLTVEQLTKWADSCLHINHLNTLVQREIAANSLERATHLSERARKRAWQILNEMFDAGAVKPAGYCEPDVAPES